MMLKPSIDKLLDRVNSKYSLVILSSKRAHELEKGMEPMMSNFDSVKPVGQALEEIESGRIAIHPNPEGKREALRLAEEEALRKEEEEKERMRQQLEEEGTAL
jgi:DNA-directed RNA polymerase subunit omega